MNYFDILLAKKLSGGSPTPPGDTYERKGVTSYPVTDSANYPLPKCDVTVTDADKCEVIVTTDNTITEDSGVYLERQSGGGNRELDEIVGGSIVWNQMFASQTSATKTEYGLTITVQNGYECIIDGTFTGTTSDMVDLIGISSQTYSFIKDHIYIALAPKIPVTVGTTATNVLMGNTNVFNYLRSNGTCVAKALNTGNSYSFGRLEGVVNGAVFNNYKFSYNIIDLTALFGSTIADYIYSLEQSTAGSGIAWAKSNGYLTEDYYGYTANKIESVSVARHITRGVNQWDEQWVVGAVQSNGTIDTSLTTRRTTDYIPIKPNTTYRQVAPSTALNGRYAYYDKNKSLIYYDGNYGLGETFTTYDNAYYVRITFGSSYGTTYNHDISINYPATDTEYHPYEEHTYPINPITLRGIPKLNASNQLYYDGDVYEASGRVTRRYGIVDLGTLNWSYSTEGDYAFFGSAVSGINRRSTDLIMVCSKYVAISGKAGSNFRSNNYDKMITNITDQGDILSIGVQDTAYNDATTFKNSLNGIYLIYEKATPTTENTSPFELNQIVDANGTEEYIDAGVEAGSRDVAIPVGHNTKYFNGKAYVKPLTAGTSDTVSMADMGIMPTSPMYISANGEIDAEYWAQVE